MTDVVLLDGQANALQTRPWVHVEALVRQLRWHSPHSAALMMWFAHGTDDGWCVLPATFPRGGHVISASDRVVGGAQSPSWMIQRGTITNSERGPVLVGVRAHRLPASTFLGSGLRDRGND